MFTWIPLFALANIEVRRPIEVDGFALASIHDVHFAVRKLERRYGKEIVRAQPMSGFPARVSYKITQPGRAPRADCRYRCRYPLPSQAPGLTPITHIVRRVPTVAARVSPSTIRSKGTLQDGVALR